MCHDFSAISAANRTLLLKICGDIKESSVEKRKRLCVLCVIKDISTNSSLIGIWNGIVWICFKLKRTKLILSLFCYYLLLFVVTYFLCMFILDLQSERSYTCRKCGKSYTYMRNLERHEKLECRTGKQVLFTCEKCGKTYTLLRNLHRHEKVECQKEKKFVCGICHHRTYYKSDLRVHVYNKHGVHCIL